MISYNTATPTKDNQANSLQTEQSIWMLKQNWFHFYGVQPQPALILIVSHKTIVLFINWLTTVPPITACDEPWPLFHFWCHHFWSKLASSTLYTRLLLEEKIFQMMPRSEWSAHWSLRYAQKCSKKWVKNSEQNFLPLHLHVAAPW